MSAHGHRQIHKVLPTKLLPTKHENLNNHARKLLTYEQTKPNKTTAWFMALLCHLVRQWITSVHLVMGSQHMGATILHSTTEIPITQQSLVNHWSDHCSYTVHYCQQQMYTYWNQIATVITSAIVHFSLVAFTMIASHLLITLLLMWRQILLHNQLKFAQYSDHIYSHFKSSQVKSSHVYCFNSRIQKTANSHNKKNMQ